MTEYIGLSGDNSPNKNTFIMANMRKITHDKGRPINEIGHTIDTSLF
jgi:hypothetical protein